MHTHTGHVISLLRKHHQRPWTLGALPTRAPCEMVNGAAGVGQLCLLATGSRRGPLWCHVNPATGPCLLAHTCKQQHWQCHPNAMAAAATVKVHPPQQHWHTIARHAGRQAGSASECPAPHPALRLPCRPASLLPPSISLSASRCAAALSRWMNMSAVSAVRLAAASSSSSFSPGAV
jgi:hypothetical protein